MKDYNVSGIYKITNTIDGKSYIGSARNIQIRWGIHRRSLNFNKHHSRYLQRAWNKYGAECFEISIIEICSIPDLISIEQYYMDTLHPEYNISQKAGSSLGVKHTPETIAKFKIAAAGRLIGYKHSDESKKNMSIAANNMTPEHRNNISKTHKGMGHKQETRDKISNIVKNLWGNPEYRRHMSEIHKGKKQSPEHIAKKNAANTGKIRTVEMRNRISDSLKGNKNSVGHKTSLETRAKLSLANSGKKHTDETKKKLSNIVRAWWAKKDQNENT
jgi:group I intron endonuclease